MRALIEGVRAAGGDGTGAPFANREHLLGSLEELARCLKAAAAGGARFRLTTRTELRRTGRSTAWRI